MSRHAVHLCLAIVIAAAGSVCSPSWVTAQAVSYTACNLWFESPAKMYSTGYRRGSMIPAGTAVSNVHLTKKYVSFTSTENGTDYRIYWIAKHHPGVSRDQWLARLLTDQDRGRLFAGLSEADRAGIEAGEVREGMSRRAVLVSWGHPPEVGTPDIEGTDWKYWIDRFRTGTVSFDGDVVSEAPPQ